MDIEGRITLGLVRFGNGQEARTVATMRRVAELFNQSPRAVKEAAVFQGFDPGSFVLELEGISDSLEQRGAQMEDRAAVGDLSLFETSKHVVGALGRRMRMVRSGTNIQLDSKDYRANILLLN